MILKTKIINILINIISDKIVRNNIFKEILQIKESIIIKDLHLDIEIVVLIIDKLCNNQMLINKLLIWIL